LKDTVVAGWKNGARRLKKYCQDTSFNGKHEEWQSRKARAILPIVIALSQFPGKAASTSRNHVSHFPDAKTSACPMIVASYNILKYGASMGISQEMPIRSRHDHVDGGLPPGMPTSRYGNVPCCLLRILGIEKAQLGEFSPL
jgi:hypothetical protein